MTVTVETQLTLLLGALVNPALYSSASHGSCKITVGGWRPENIVKVYETISWLACITIVE